MKEQDKTDILCNDLLHENGEKENGTLKNWKEGQPDNKRLHELLSRIETSSQISEYADSVRDSICIQLNSRIDKSTLRLRWFRLSAAAAAILLLIGLSGYFSYNEGYKRQNSQLITMENPLGMKSSVILPDGSKVTLNAGSTLTYPNTFTEDERKVRIKGEVYFEVAHDTEHPFIVYTGGIQVKVLGTKFNVKAYEEENDIEVTLTEGSVLVGVENSKSSLKIEPTQQVRFDKTRKSLVKQNVNLNNYTAWKDGKFYFNGVSFENIARQLERKFNVHIQTDSEKLKNTVFTGDFVRGENLEQILRVITLDKRINYQIEGDLVYIREK